MSSIVVRRGVHLVLLGVLHNVGGLAVGASPHDQVLVGGVRVERAGGLSDRELDVFVLDDVSALLVFVLLDVLVHGLLLLLELDLRVVLLELFVRFLVETVLKGVDFMLVSLEELGESVFRVRLLLVPETPVAKEIESGEVNRVDEVENSQGRDDKREEHEPGHRAIVAYLFVGV